jgi:hypothetical protein
MIEPIDYLIIEAYTSQKFLGDLKMGLFMVLRKQKD